MPFGLKLAVGAVLFGLVLLLAFARPTSEGRAGLRTSTAAALDGDRTSPDSADRLPAVDSIRHAATRNPTRQRAPSSAGESRIRPAAQIGRDSSMVRTAAHREGELRLVQADEFVFDDAGDTASSPTVIPTPFEVVEPSWTHSPSDQPSPLVPSAPLPAPRMQAGSRPESATSIRIAPSGEQINAPVSDLDGPTGGLRSSPESELRKGVLVRAARNAVSLGDLRLAIARFEELLHEFPSFAEARLEYAGLLNQARRLSDAQLQVERLLELDPENLEYHKRYADLLIQQEKHLSAEKSLRKIMAHGTANPEIIISLARVLAWQGRLDEATLMYDEHAVEFSVLRGEVEGKLARLLLEIKRPAEAIGIIRRLLENDPFNGELQLDLILANARLGQQLAVHEQITALEQNPGVLPEQRIALADTLYREAHFQAALSLFLQAAQADPYDLVTQAKIVRTYVRLYDMPAAQMVLDQVGENSANRAIQLETANLKGAIGEHAAAYAIYQGLLADDPNDVQAIKGMGALYHAIADYRRAESQYRRGLNLAPKDFELRQLLAESLLEQARVDEALSTVQPQPRSFGALERTWKPEEAVSAADLLVRGDQYSQAEQVCHAALLNGPEPATMAELKTVLGFALLEQGRATEALHALEQARILPDGNTPKLRYGLYRCLRQLDRAREAEMVIAQELNTFGPATLERVTIANLAMDDCNCQLAKQLLQQALMFDASNVFLLVRLAEANAMCNRFGGGCSERIDYGQALSLSPSNTRATLGLARSYARTSDSALSDRKYTQLLNAFPEHDLARLEHARLLYAWKGVDRANHAYMQAEKRHEPHRYLPHNRFDQADLNVIQADYEQASHKLQAVEAERSGKYWKDWKPLSALGKFQVLTDIEPTNQEAHFDLAQILASLNRTQLAIAEYDELLAIEPCHAEAMEARKRMVLELRPQLVNRFDFEHRTGRQGLTNMTSLRLETLGIKPYGDQDEYFVAGYAHRFLRSHQGEDADGNVAILGVHAKPLERLNLFAVAELEAYDSGFSTRPTFRTGLNWRSLADTRFGFSGFLDNVAENGESIRQDTYRGGLEVNVTKYVNWRWELDGMYRYAAYSDHNSMHEASLQNDFLVLPGRHQLHAKLDLNLISYDNQTVFGPTPGDLLGTIHPYFSPSGFAYVTGGLEYRSWISPHNFRGANEQWYSVYGGARVDSDSVGYGLVQLRGHRDYCGWLSAHVDTSAIFSAVYEGVGVSGYLTLRMP